MKYLSRLLLMCLISCSFIMCKEKEIDKVGVLSQKVEVEYEIAPGAENIASYLNDLKDKRVGLVVNQTSLLKDVHLVDSLLKLNISISKIFAPEHGFRGEADAGEKVDDGIDSKTNIPLVSLYGNNKKPTKEQVIDLDVIVFDIQDVGARFYTYISTLHYVMEAAAENDIAVIVLDRPNPNGHYVDGPVLEEKYKSFVGMHPVPVIYGMTIGEYAQMINGENWMENGIQANLKVVKNSNYKRTDYYRLPVKPSPNLPNSRSILLYPSLCFFEGTTVSVGRGTDKQFQVIGHPDYMNSNFSFTPTARSGAKYPKHENKVCNGVDLSNVPTGLIMQEGRLNLSYLISTYNSLPNKESVFFNKNNFFEKLAGTESLRQQILDGISEDKIRESWRTDLDEFMKMREQYLLYE